MILIRKCFAKIRELRLKYLSSVNLIFAFHHLVILLFYGKIKSDFTTFFIGNTNAYELKQHLDSLSTKPIFDNPSPRKLGNKHSSLNFRSNLYDLLNEDITYFEVSQHPVIDKLLRQIEPKCKEYLRSPFVFVSVSAWKTQPNAVPRDRGPTRRHRDGYAPGHAKCLIYVHSLNSEMGLIEVGSEIISSTEAGLALLFQNSGVTHRSIPGHTYYRYTFDITMMRTLIQSDPFRDYAGTSDDRHLSSPVYAYIK